MCQGGWTALMWAAYKGRVEVTELLLETGANPNTTGQVTHTVTTLLGTPVHNLNTTSTFTKFIMLTLSEVRCFYYFVLPV